MEKQFYQIACGKCRHTRKVTMEEFKALVGSDAWRALNERIRKGEAAGGLLFFNSGCKECKPRIRVNGILCAFKLPQTLVSHAV